MDKQAEPKLVTATPDWDPAPPQMHRDRRRSAAVAFRDKPGGPVALWQSPSGTLHRTREDARQGRHAVRPRFGVGWRSRPLSDRFAGV